MVTQHSYRMHGAVYTKPIIVELILDLTGYTSDKDLENFKLLDPAFGDGVFLEAAVHRLMDSLIKRGYRPNELIDHLGNCIRGIELRLEAYQAGRHRLQKVLEGYGFSKTEINWLINQWIIQADFLLWQEDTTEAIKFDFVVGNPPYVRQELIQDELIKKYRKRYTTIYDRADLYVPFIQHSLELLSEQGTLGIICSDRFTKNRYGKKLRKFITDNYQVRYIVDLHKTSPFENEVTAYPAIYVIKTKNYDKSVVRAVYTEVITSKVCQDAKDFLLSNQEPDQSSKEMKTYVFSEWFAGDEPWIIQSQECREILKRLENRFPLIEDDVHGCKIRIGVATGADKVYIVDPQQVDIEPEVLLPLVTTADISSGRIIWSGKHVINPFNSDGELINLDDFPRLKIYFQQHEKTIKNRNVAKKNPSQWFRTIDRIYPEIVHQPKLLIPDMKNTNHIVKDEGAFYPHHNLYYILPGNWNIDILRAILLSSVVKFFIWSYATKMRGDTLRYQAQYLRKIRLPDPKSLTSDQKERLMDERVIQSQEYLDSIVAEIYQLSSTEIEIIKDALG